MEYNSAFQFIPFSFYFLIFLQFMYVFSFVLIFNFTSSFFIPNFRTSFFGRISFINLFPSNFKLWLRAKECLVLNYLSVNSNRRHRRSGNACPFTTEPSNYFNFSISHNTTCYSLIRKGVPVNNSFHFHFLQLLFEFFLFL